MPEAAIESPKLTRSQHIREQLHTLALCIGLRPAARRLGINEDTACYYSAKEKWNLPEVFKFTGGPPLQQRRGQAKQSSAPEALESSFREQSEDTRLYLSSAALKASHAAASMDGASLLGKIESQSMLNVARTADVTHGWQAARQQPAVQIANVVLPTPEQSAELKSVDRKLDVLTRLFNRPPGGGDAPHQDG